MHHQRQRRLTPWPKVGIVLTLAVSFALTGAPAHAAPTAGEAWAELESELTDLVEEADDDGVTVGISVTDLSGTFGGAALDLGSQEPVKAASVIKLPLLAALMDELDAGTLSLDELVTIEDGDPNIVGGSGTLRDRDFPLDISIEELMELMVQVSDNTATNVLIDRAGGFDAVNDYIAGLGFDAMWLGRKMIHPAVPPLQENWITSGEVNDLLEMLADDSILSPESSEHIIDLMRGQLVDTKFGAVIPRDVLANKTGELADVSHDSGYIFVPGREVALTVTTAFDAGVVSRPTVDELYVQRAAAIVYAFTLQDLDDGDTSGGGGDADGEASSGGTTPVGVDADQAPGEQLPAVGVYGMSFTAGLMAALVLLTLGAAGLLVVRRAR